MKTLKTGDLVSHANIADYTTGVVIKITKREVASPHPSYRGKFPPLTVTVTKTAEVMWGDGIIEKHDVQELRKIKKDNLSEKNE